MEKIGMVWAQTPDRVIGRDGGMPWHVPEDLAHFREVTHGHPVIMGRRTWESFPERFRPLPGRTNIVVTRSQEAAQSLREAGASVVSDFREGLEAARAAEGAEQIWVIGGSSLFEQAMDVADVVEMTQLDLDEAGDTLAPELDGRWQRTAADPQEGWHRSRNEDVQYRFERWERS